MSGEREADDERDSAYSACQRLNGACSCRNRGSYPCDAMMLIIFNDGVDGEIERMEQERQSE